MARFKNWRARQRGRALGNQHQQWLERFDATEAGIEFKSACRRRDIRAAEFDRITDCMEAARVAYLLSNCKCDLCNVLRAQAARRRAAAVDVERLTGDNPQAVDDRQQFEEQERFDQQQQQGE